MFKRLHSDERGFTLIVTMITLLIAGILVAAALGAANGDTRLVRNDLDQKKAYYAAQAGVSDYEFHLNQDVNYWSYCTNVPSPSAVNQIGSTTNRRSVPGSTDETYAIELLPATGQSSCNTASPGTSMIESSGTAIGTFRIRSTGYSGNVQRSLVATFRRASFVDYIYYTVYETLAPSAYSSASDRTAAATACAKYWRNGRQPAGTNNYCSQIFFLTGDTINGPLHTEDELAICGSPVFGRNAQDAIEVVAPAPGHSNQGNSGCSDSPTFKGTYIPGANSIQPPPSNAQLKQIALPAYQWTGQTHITLNGTSMTVVNNGNTTTVPFPSNGVVYVSSSACATLYTPFGVTYPGASGCGVITVDGTYSGALTLASDNDIVIDGNLTHTGSGLLGLIANNYVRVYHPCSNGNNQTGSINNLNIDAAILAVTGSFIVDNYDCGSSLGSLTVNGAIAQIFRGPVGTFGTSATGYLKNYTYDDRLRTQEPPHFLNPVQAAWHVQRETECARGSTSCP
jgi:Tfp pilus assembly protein PilE